MSRRTRRRTPSELRGIPQSMRGGDVGDRGTSLGRLANPEFRDTPEALSEAERREAVERLTSTLIAELDADHIRPDTQSAMLEDCRRMLADERVSDWRRQQVQAVHHALARCIGRLAARHDGAGREVGYMQQQIALLSRLADDTEAGVQRRQIQAVRTPDGPVALIRQTAERLLQEGVISGTLDGDLHAADAATVKAAIMASAVCDFCSVPGASHYYDIPDFGITTDPRGGTNYSPMAGSAAGGWMLCDTCDGLVKADKRRQLTDRALETHAFPKFSRRMVEEVHAKFWEGMDDRAEATGAAAAIADYVEDRMDPIAGKAKITERDRRIDAVCKHVGLTPEEIASISEHHTIGRDMVSKLVRFNRLFDASGPGDLDQRWRRILDQQAMPHKPLADVVPHWQRALDARFEAMQNIAGIADETRTVLAMDDALDLNDPSAVKAQVERARRVEELRFLGFDKDLKALRVAQTYSFSGETTAAIREAARSIPHDAPLSAIETPNAGAGWYWFAEPLPLAASPASDSTAALLWCWADGETGPAMRFASFIVYKADDRTKDLRGRVMPSTKWYWPVEMSFHDMIAYNRQLHRRDYGDGGQRLRDGMTIAGEEETIALVAELSLFFMMTGLWFRQTVPILTREPGSVEGGRQARKRLAREHGLAELPTVQVVALRRSVRADASTAETEHQREGAREYHCRWIVKGHPRMQACGPGRKDRKLIWIEAHPAGPEDKPLRTRERVYAVVR